MNLILQLKSIAFSFCFGIFFYIFVHLSEKYIYSSNKVIKILSSIFVSMCSCLLYFIIIKKINNGIIHFYFILTIILSYYISYKVKTLNIFKKKNKWFLQFVYTQPGINSLHFLNTWYN